VDVSMAAREYEPWQDPELEGWRNPDRPEVFCRDCHWYGGEVDTWHICLHAHAKVVRKGPVGMMIERQPADVRNAHNDCLDFQSLRFWSFFRRSHGWQITLVGGLWLLLLGLLWWRGGH
jgi:hypothetical protein